MTAQAKTSDPIQTATDIVAATGDFVKGRTEELRSAGVSLARIRLVLFEPSERASELDRLQVRATPAIAPSEFLRPLHCARLSTRSLLRNQQPSA